MYRGDANFGHGGQWELSRLRWGGKSSECHVRGSRNLFCKSVNVKVIVISELRDLAMAAISRVPISMS